MNTKKLHSKFFPAIFLAVLGFFYFVSTVGAIGLYDNSISAVVTPENPNPKNAVTIRLDSPLINLSGATISWFVNGKKIKGGKDMRTFQLDLPESGKTEVEARIATADYGIISKDFSFNPTLVEILYEANSYTPPFYKGKALIPPEGVVTLLAVPNFKGSAGSISSKNLVFTWKKDGTVDGNNSGLGKNTYVYNNGRLPEDAPTIEVTITSPENNLRGFTTTRLPSVNPEIIFYENNPLLGVVLNQSLPGNYFLNKQELTLVGYPYYFGGKSIESVNLQYAWQINSANVPQTGNSKAGLTVRKPDGKGSSSISLSLENSRRIFQTAKANFLINYGN